MDKIHINESVLLHNDNFFHETFIAMIIPQKNLRLEIIFLLTRLVFAINKLPHRISDYIHSQMEIFDTIISSRSWYFKV